MVVVLMIDGIGQDEADVEIAEALGGGVAAVGADIEAVGGVRIGVPKIGVELASDALVAIRDEGSIPFTRSKMISSLNTGSCAVPLSGFSRSLSIFIQPLYNEAQISPLL